jgi:hypothetical protein
MGVYQGSVMWLNIFLALIVNLVWHLGSYELDLGTDVEVTTLKASMVLVSESFSVWYEAVYMMFCGNLYQADRDCVDQRKDY